MRTWILAALLPVTMALAACAGTDTRCTDGALQAAVASPARNPAFVARDAARHPYEELAFFGLQPDMTVVELWPSGGYWTEILAPYLHDAGSYIAAQPPAADPAKFDTLLASDPARFGRVQRIGFDPAAGAPLAADGTADAVLTFRNLHNWLADGSADAALATIYRALKPGGILGIEDHRGLATVPQSQQTAQGYVREDAAIAMAQRAGFTFVASSPINDNPRDTKQWPAGVWTLPPTLRLGEQDRAAYQAVGEADNFTLLFRKPQ